MTNCCSQRSDVALRSKNDYRKIRSFSGDDKHILVVGNGYIGSKIAADLKVEENGVVVNEKLQASDPAIYAAGDIISYPDPILGRTKSEHVMHATKSGYVAGQNLAGKPTDYTYTPYFYSRVFDVSWEAFGKISSGLSMYQEKLSKKGSLTYYFDQAGELQGILKWNVKVNLNHLRNIFGQYPKLTDLQKVLPLKQVN
ncbi:FAD/NAD(P)-binding oxidoreductase [Liquorilactobacillus vini]|uniref:monodehydroascorbate reductase (NADH) n=1 Tax=Liquorilactobacillus vini DSM 20605 TaxID=1133569 RepID=A0A0R2C553_9LACO|nr:FAD/NAD(P)-binding oxidoreductase [Liquorilactobacillus vini]KRM83222.1 putidaredoxin reductase [Liquorilactobacillus vini DSM 20605]